MLRIRTSVAARALLGGLLAVLQPAAAEPLAERAVDPSSEVRRAASRLGEQAARLEASPDGAAQIPERLLELARSLDALKGGEGVAREARSQHQAFLQAQRTAGPAPRTGERAGSEEFPRKFAKALIDLANRAVLLLAPAPAEPQPSAERGVPERESPLRGSGASERVARMMGIGLDARDAVAGVPASPPAAPPVAAAPPPPVAAASPVARAASGPPAPAEALPTPRALKPGSKGPLVEQAQRDLNEFLRSRKRPEIAEDGVYGRGTKAAIREFQSANPGQLAKTGIVGAKTARLLRQRAEGLRRAEVAGAGAKPSAPPSKPAPVSAPAAAQPATLKRGARGPAVLAAQEDLNMLFWEAKKPRLKQDGDFGPGTERAVAAFQRERGMKPEKLGQLDVPTAAELRQAASAARARAELPVEVAGARATVYHPKAARTASQRRIEGPNNDRLTKPLCTAEGFARGECHAITVAIDQRLHVRYGTPVESPELETAYYSMCAERKLLCRRPQFAIKDTGACWAFKGSGHIDVATETDHRSGFGKALNLSGVTLRFPKGLPPDFNLSNRCG